MLNETCLVCNHKLVIGYQLWHFICKSCGYEKSNLQPNINIESSHELIDENGRKIGLKKLRLSNFKKIINDIKSIKSHGYLMDVGCAHGWFLDAAKKDFDVYGLEPDKNVFDKISKSNNKIRNGYFPDALYGNEKFDIITFNDVIEHIPDIHNVISSCKQSLNKDGLLVLNLPSSCGIFYKLSNWLCRLGFIKFFERMWQKDLPSPHVHYFNPNNLVTILESNGFDVITKKILPTITLAGLYARISYTGNLNILSRLFVYISIALFLPLLSLAPKDAFFIISRRK